MNAVATARELQSLSEAPSDHVIEVGIEPMLLFQCADPDETSALSPEERGTISEDLLSEYS